MISDPKHQGITDFFIKIKKIFEIFRHIRFAIFNFGNSTADSPSLRTEEQLDNNIHKNQTYFDSSECSQSVLPELQPLGPPY